MLGRLRLSNNWASTIDELEKEADEVENKEERSELLFELGNLSEEVVPERDRALGIYQRAWKLHPENIKALTRARELYRELGRLEMVAKVGELELRMRQNEPEAGELAGIVGEALLDIGQRDRAINILEIAAERSPSSVRVKDALAAAQYDPEFWSDAVERLVSEADTADSNTAARMLLRAARIVRIESPEGEQYEKLLSTALEHDPSEETTNYLFEQLLSRSERWDELEAHQMKRADAESDVKTRTLMYRNFALEWNQRYSDRERAGKFFRKAVEATVQNGSKGFHSLVAGFKMFRELYGEKGEWSEFMEVSGNVLDKLQDEQKLYVALHAGIVAWRKLDDVEQANRFFSQVRDVAPNNPDALAFFESTAGMQLAQGTMEETPAENAVAQMATGTDAELPVVSEVAKAVSGEMLASPKNGELESDESPTDEMDETPSVVIEASEDRGEDTEQVQTIESESESRGDDTDADIVSNDETRAEDDTQPSPANDMVEPREVPPELAAAMEQAREKAGAGADGAITAWQEVVKAHSGELAPRMELVKVLKDEQRWNAAVDALKDAERKAASTDEERVAVLGELAAVYRQVNNDVQVVQALQRMLELRPNDTKLMDELCTQYESMKKWPDLVKVLQKKASLAESEGEKIALHMQVAELYLERFSNQAEAIKAFEKVLELDPDNEKASTHLLAVYQKRRDWEKYISLREREIVRCTDSSARAEMVYEVAKLASTRVKKPEVCTVWWEKVLEEDQEHQEALSELEKLYERSQNWTGLADVCSRSVQNGTEKQQISSLQKLGRLYTERLAEPKKAIEAWRQLLELKPDDRRAQDAIKKLYVAEKSWHELEAYYRSTGKLGEFVRVLEREIDADGASVEERAQTAIKVAETYRDELSKPDRATRAFEKALSIDENCMPAAEALIPLYEGGRDPRKLGRVLEVQLAGTEDAGLRQDRLQRLAEFSEKKLKDNSGALDWWLKAYSEQPTADWIRPNIERLAPEVGAWEKVVSSYESVYDDMPDGESTLPLREVVARVREQELADIEGALSANKSILEIDPENSFALEGLERLYIGQENYSDLLEIYQRKLDLAETAESISEIQFRLGGLYEQEIKDDAKAVETYQNVLDSDPQNLRAMQSLDRLYQRREQWSDLARVIDQQLDLVSTDESQSESLELKYRLGQLREEHLDQPAQAIDSYREILAEQSEHQGARSQLEAYLSNADHRGAVADILEPIYSEQENWQSLVTVYQIQSETSQDSYAKVDLLTNIGSIQAEKLGETEAAFEAYASAFREKPSAEQARLKLEELAPLMDGGTQKLVALFEEGLENPELDSALAHEICLKVAGSYRDTLDDSEKATKYLQRALEIEPDDRSAMDSLESIYARDEKYPELLEVYRRKADVAVDPETRVDLLARIASVHEERLNDSSSAIDAYSEILAHDGENAVALRSLDRLYEEGSRWQDLADNLGQQLVLCEDEPTRASLLFRLAGLRETHLNEVGNAIETYRQVLDIDPRHQGTVEALERLVRSEEHELVVAEILEPVYGDSADWQKQVLVYEIIARHSYDPERKIQLYHTIAELQELGGDSSDSAFNTYANALKQDPRSQNTQGQLERLASGHNRWGDLVATYSAIADENPDEELRVQLHNKVAQIQQGELGDDSAAVATYEKILALAPHEVDALTSILRIHESNQAYPELVSALVRKSELVTETESRVELLTKAAKIQEDVLENSEEAIATYQKVLHAEDTNTEAIGALERLYTKLGRWHELEEVFVRRADIAEDPQAKKDCLFALGRIHEGQLGDADKAIDTYQAVLDLDANDSQAIQSLDRLYGQTQRWYDLLQNLELQVELSESTSETVGLKYRIANLWRTELGDQARAVETYNEVLLLDSDHSQTLEALEEMLSANNSESAMAARVLEPVYESRGDGAKLVRVLGVIAAQAPDPDSKIELLQRMASIQEDELGDGTAAFSAYSEAVREDNGNEQALSQLNRLAESTGQWNEFAELLGSEADKSLDVPRQVDLWGRLARIQEDRLGQPEAAVTTYKRILDAEYDHRDSVQALSRLFTQAEAWPDLVEILKRQAQLAESEEEILSYQFQHGRVLEQSMGDIEGAIEVYREIVSTDPSHSGALGALEMLFSEGRHTGEISQVLEPIYEDTGDWEKLHSMYVVQLGSLDGDSKMSMYQRLAELCEGRLDDKNRAFDWWGRAVADRPSSELAIEEADRLAQEENRFFDLIEVYERAAAGTSDGDAQKNVLVRAGAVLERELGDAERAIGAYNRVLEIDDSNAEALASLDRLYSQIGEDEKLADILQRRLAVTLDGDEIAELHLRRGQVYAGSLADEDKALACYGQVLEQDSRNRPALEAQEEIFYRRQDWRSLYNTYEKLVDCAEGDAEMGEAYARMAKLASDGLEDDDTAQDLWGRVLDILGDEPRALSELASLYTRRGHWEDLVEVLERQANLETSSTEEQVRAFKKLGHVWSAKLERDRNSLDAWLRASELDPNDLESLNALAGLYRETQSWEELSQTLRRIISVGLEQEALGENEVIALHAQLGELEGDLLGRIDESVAAWRQVTAIDPTDFRALNALEQLFTREARWEECIEVLQRKALVMEDETAQLDTLLQAGSIWEEKVEDLGQAAATYERVRATSPGNAVASERLEAIYRQQYQWEQLNEVLLARVEYTDDPHGQIEILQSVARVYEEELSDQESAFIVLQAAFKEDYAHESTSNELERLATATGKWQELLLDYTEVVQGLEAEEPEKACDLWVKIGRWYADHAQHVDYAVHSVQQALRINPEHLGAMGALASLHRQSGSWHELAEVLQKHATLEPDGEKKVGLYLAQAELMETQLQDPDQAISAHRAALEIEPDCVPAMNALERLYRSTGRWNELIDVLTKSALLRNEDSEIVEAKIEIGRIWDETLVDSGQAIRAYQEVLDIDPTNSQALRSLEGLYENTGQSEPYLDILEAQLDSSSTNEEQLALYQRMASAWEQKFGKLDRAAECYEKIVVLDKDNNSAYRELERLYQQEGKFDSLVDTYRRHILSITDPSEQADLYCAMGEVYETSLNDSDRAIEAYIDVLTFDENEPRALDALGRLYENIEEWDRAIDVMEQLVQTVDSPLKKVDLYHRVGRITHVNLQMPEEAEQKFLQALAIDEGHVPTMEALVRLYGDRGDWLKAAQMMVRAEGYSENMLDKSRLLTNAAGVYQEKLGQTEDAKKYYGMVMEIDPEHVPAAEPLADLYFQSGDWEKLMPVLDMLVRKAPQRDLSMEENRELVYRTARCADALNDHAKAVEYYGQAYEIDPSYLPVLTGRADLLFNMKEWDASGKIYQTILVQHRDSQSTDEVVRTYYRLGMVRQSLGEPKKALNMFEKALEIDPGHVETLLAVIDIQTEHEEWEAVVYAKRGLLTTATGPDAVTWLGEIGEIYVNKLNNTPKAIAAYVEALDHDSENHQMLHRLLELYTESEQWNPAIEVIDRFIEMETDPLRKGSYYQAAGTICRDKLKELDDAVEYFNHALDSFFHDGASSIPKEFFQRALKPFEDIDRILTSKRDWRSQERAYRTMIKRLKQGDSILLNLWHALGEIYRSRLKDYEAAIQAFEVAQKLDPKNAGRGEILAELYVLGGSGHADKAVAQHLAMIQREPFKYDSYKALRRIYMDTQQYDKTWCVCSALSFLKKADAEEQQFFEQYKPRGFAKAKKQMTEEIWRLVNHPGENPYVSAIFGSIWQAGAMLGAQPHKAFGLNRKNRVDVATDQVMFSKVFNYASGVLRVPMPDVFLQAEEQGELLIANSQEKGRLIPSFLVQGKLLSGRSEKEIAFASGKWLTYLRPDHFLKVALPTNTELKIAFLSAIRLVKPDFPIPPDAEPLVAQYLPQMQKVMAQQPQWIEQLHLVVGKFLPNANKVDLGGWARAVDFTAHRVGLLLSGDLEVAAGAVSMEPVVVGGPQIKDKVKELVTFAVSEDYFEARKRLGLTIG